MTRARVIELGVRIADVHRRYHEIHGALFGAASFHLIIDALRGKRRRTYKDFAQTLKQLHDELAVLDTQIDDLAQGEPAKGADRELRQVLGEYTRALGEAVAGLQTIFAGLEQDETAYRDTGPDSPSCFTRDKLRYDHLLLALERLGTRLNRLFSDY